VRYKFDITTVPPWKRWSRDALARIHLSKLPEVEPPIDVLSCTDPELVTDAICEVVPWKRKYEHHQWLHSVCSHVCRLLPMMTPRDITRVILAFSSLHGKRKTNKLLYYNYEAFSSLFQALPHATLTEKTFLPVLRAYHRMGVNHEPFVQAAGARIVSGELELSPADLAEVVRLHGMGKIRNPKLFDFAAEVLDLRFAYFSEDAVGDMARTFCELSYYCDPFVAALRRELPYRLHEYSWWNLLDIGEMYLKFKIQDREIVERIGNEIFKLVFSMKDHYPAKALKILAFLDLGDKRTFRLLIRTLPRTIPRLSAQGTADTIMACAAIDVVPTATYHRLKGTRLYQKLVSKLLPDIASLPPITLCNVFAALVQVGHKPTELCSNMEALVKHRPFKFHVEHLISLLRDFRHFEHRGQDIFIQLLRRQQELSECTPSALSAVPFVLAGQPRPIAGPQEEAEHKFLREVSRLLCKPGNYALPEDARSYRKKDDLWWQKLRQKHFRLRRQLSDKNASVLHGQVDGNHDAQAELGLANPALLFLTRTECVQLICGCADVDWQDETLLECIVQWLCHGRRYAELEPVDVANILSAFSRLRFTSELLRVALEHAVLRTAPDLPADKCAASLRSALDVGMGVRSAAILAIIRRCTSEMTFVPSPDLALLQGLGPIIQDMAEQEVLAAASDTKLLQRMPLEFNLFTQALSTSSGARAPL